MHRWGTGFRPVGNMEGCLIFVDALMRFAEQSRNPRLTPIIARLAAPLSVAVRGRDGVGRGTVAAALAASGVAVAPDERAADVTVLVIAEALKPEDTAPSGDGRRPDLIILNKADLSGFGAGGPLTVAHRRAADYRARTSVPVIPMIGLLATADLDPELLAALQVLVGHPADLTSTDAFVQGDHPLSASVRVRLLDTLDRFGIAHAVLAGDRAPLPSLLRELSQIDRVVAHLDAVCAPLRYRRVQAAIGELRSLAAQLGNEQLSEFLASDQAVLGVMTAAVGVVEAAGAHVDRGDDPTAHLRRAVHWRRYGRGPVDALHRACATDICRGSLRLIGRSR